MSMLRHLFNDCCFVGRNANVTLCPTGQRPLQLTVMVWLTPEKSLHATHTGFSC